MAFAQPAMQPRFKLGHISALDGIRGFAVLAVAASHIGYVLGGNVGLDVFFVLSGFLITSLLIREWSTTGDISFKQFYSRRAIRLCPALITVLVAVCVYETFYWSDAELQNIFLRSLYVILYMTNWVWALTPDQHLGGLGALAALWSLALEEQFYLIWPVVFGALSRWRARPIIISAFLCFMIAASTACRYFLAQAGVPAARWYAGSDSHADPILFGCLLAILAHNVSVRIWSVLKPWLAAAVPSAMVVLIVTTMVSKPAIWSPTITAICAGLLILTVTVIPARLSLAVFECPVLIWFGKISYGLYLWHSVWVTYLNQYSPILPFLIALGLATASYYLLELPILNMRNQSAHARIGALQPLPRPLPSVF